MRFTVIWKPTAEATLAQIWVDSADRAGVAAAANRIDEILKQDPESKGESRSGSFRIVFVEPLAVDFQVLVQVSQ